MTDKQIKDLETRLHEACQKWIANGGRIVSCNSAEDTLPNCACALGALHGKDPFPLSAEAADIGLTPTELWDFIKGFDSGEVATPLNKLGHAFRKQYCND